MLAVLFEYWKHPCVFLFSYGHKWDGYNIKGVREMEWPSPCCESPAQTQIRPSVDPAQTQRRPSSDPAQTQHRPSAGPNAHVLHAAHKLGTTHTWVARTCCGGTGTSRNTPDPLTRATRSHISEPQQLGYSVRWPIESHPAVTVHERRSRWHERIRYIC